MPAPIPVPVRQAIWRRHQRGQSPAAIAAALGLAPRTVRHLLQLPLPSAADHLGPCYAGRPLTPQAVALRDRARQLRRLHPAWGAGLIRVVLQREQPHAAVPCQRTVQRWLHAADTGAATPAPAGRRPATATPPADRPHTVWQMDAAEQIRLQSGRRVSWLRVVDECSGAVLQTTVFSPRQVAPSPGHRRAAGIA